jgi:hypothetical protein
MRRLTLAVLAALALPAALSAQGASSVQMEDLAIRNLSETRRLMLLPNETVGFRVLGTASDRSLRVTTGHLVEGRFYQARVTITEVGGTTLRTIDGTISSDAPTLDIGALADGDYRIAVELADLGTGGIRAARSRVVLR